MARSVTPAPVKRPFRLVAGAALLTMLVIVAGCGGGWKNIPIESIDETTQMLDSEELRVTLNDGRVFQFRLSRVEYPYLWGDRFLGSNMPLKPMRIDLREVARIDIQRS
jgi:hypothetical protein